VDQGESSHVEQLGSGAPAGKRQRNAQRKQFDEFSSLLRGINHKVSSIRGPNDLEECMHGGVDSTKCLESQRPVKHSPEPSAERAVSKAVEGSRSGNAPSTAARSVDCGHEIDADGASSIMCVLSSVEQCEQAEQGGAHQVSHWRSGAGSGQCGACTDPAEYMALEDCMLLDVIESLEHEQDSSPKQDCAQSVCNQPFVQTASAECDKSVLVAPAGQAALQPVHILVNEDAEGRSGESAENSSGSRHCSMHVEQLLAVAPGTDDIRNFQREQGQRAGIVGTRGSVPPGSPGKCPAHREQGPHGTALTLQALTLPALASRQPMANQSCSRAINHMRQCEMLAKLSEAKRPTF
jgi:hypothetical protein